MQLSISIGSFSLSRLIYKDQLLDKSYGKTIPKNP